MTTVISSGQRRKYFEPAMTASAMNINKQFLIDTLGWGFLLWLAGYILGILLFMVVPVSAIGWIVSPVAILITLWVLIRKVESRSLHYYLIIGITWTVLAVVLDYFLLVKLFNPEDGYYKLDVYIYYSLMFILPLVVGLTKRGKQSNERAKG
jgi:hypothetical protein